MKSILVIFLSCIIAQVVYSQVPFEGVITYKVETVLKVKDSPYNEYYSQKYGDTLKIFYALNGNKKVEYLNAGKLGMAWAIYIQSSNTEFAKWNSMDSIFYYNCSELITQLEEFKDGDERIILGKKCNSVVVKAYEPKGDETIIQRFFYSGDEYASPKLYSNYKDGYLDMIYKKSNSHFLRRELELKYINVIFEAIEIDRKKISKDIFAVPDNISMVKM